MRVLILSNYFYPETVGDGVRMFQLACDLRDRGHTVTVLTSFPSYPGGVVFSGYRNRLRLHEVIQGIRVIRAFTYATPSKAFWSRVLSFGCFCGSSIVAGMLPRVRAEVVFAVLPPLPLGISAWWLSKLAGAALVVNVVDIHPDIAVSLGVLKNKFAIHGFRMLERLIYRLSARIIVISDGFRRNLLAKGVPEPKIDVIPPWADIQAIQPATHDNAFRRELQVDGNFVVLYSGGLTHNACLDSLLQAAHKLRSHPVTFVIVGDGVRKQALTEKATELGLWNVKFLPFQPLERYPEVLAASDITTVTLNSHSTFFSVPSKIYRQMAAARPVLAITEPGNELTRLIEESQCGVCVRPDDVEGLTKVIRQSMRDKAALTTMGQNGREYVLTKCGRAGCVSAIESVLVKAGRS